MLFSVQVEILYGYSKGVLKLITKVFYLSEECKIISRFYRLKLTITFRNRKRKYRATIRIYRTRYSGLGG